MICRFHSHRVGDAGLLCFSCCKPPCVADYIVELAVQETPLCSCCFHVQIYQWWVAKEYTFIFSHYVCVVVKQSNKTSHNELGLSKPRLCNCTLFVEKLTIFLKSKLQGYFNTIYVTVWTQKAVTITLLYNGTILCSLGLDYKHRTNKTLIQVCLIIHNKIYGG